MRATGSQWAHGHRGRAVAAACDVPIPFACSDPTFPALRSSFRAAHDELADVELEVEDGSADSDLSDESWIGRTTFFFGACARLNEPGPLVRPA